MDKDDTNNDPCDDVSGKEMSGWLSSNPTVVPKLKVHDKCGTPDCCGECETADISTVNGYPDVHKNESREGYYDYMLRRYREENEKDDIAKVKTALSSTG
tara:strand:+ start:1988 stop:2287 length:300 start_codon:yes stop_codon:yes gene_type:complete